MRAFRHSLGMTLLEVMVAMALLAVLGVMVSKGLTQVIRARDLVYEEQARWRSIAMAWARMGEDVTTAVDGLPGGVPEVRWQGQRASAQWAVWGAAGSVLPVQYSLHSGIVLRTLGADLSRPQKTLPGTGRVDSGASNLQAQLLDGVRTMSLSFLDSRGEWHERWPKDGAPYDRPHALRVALVLDDGRDVTRIFALP